MVQSTGWLLIFAEASIRARGVEGRPLLWLTFLLHGQRALTSQVIEAAMPTSCL